MRFPDIQSLPKRGLLFTIFALGLVGPVGAWAQTTTNTQTTPQARQSGGWRRFGDAEPPPADDQLPPITAQPADQGPPPGYQEPPYQGPPAYQQGQPVYQGQPGYQGPGPAQAPYQGQPNYPSQSGPYQGQQYPPPVNVPVGPTLTIPAGTWITVRVNQPLSSDMNQSGDAFSATLVQPLVANGIVIARRGEMVAGRVAEVVKAGRASGVSRLGVELTEVALVDGQQVPLHTQLVGRQGETSVGSDVAAVGATAGIGAAIGAAAAGGFGAGMGAIAGAGAATIGVLSTRGRATFVGPETALTFRLAEPITISTERAPYAFQAVGQQDYAQPQQLQQRRPMGPGPGGPGYYGGMAPYPAYYGGGYPGYYGGAYYGPGYGYYGGPSVFIYSGPRYYPRYYGRRW